MSIFTLTCNRRGFMRDFTYENRLELIRLNTITIENYLKNNKLEFLNIHDASVEWGILFPKFAYPFYNFVIRNQRIPTQYEYLVEYCNYKDNKNIIQGLNLTKTQKLGLKARIYRTYPSLVRDLHFGVYLRETGFYNEVFYNEDIDIKYGIDLIIRKEESEVGICLFTDTKNARIARIVKEDRYKLDMSIERLEIPIMLSNCRKCGDFFIYGINEKKIIDDHFAK